jgi:hypothetical protein
LPEKWFFRNYFLNFPVFVCHYKSWSTENTFQSKENLTWFLEKCFSFILDGKHFPEVVKNLKISYYLLIILNLVLKLLINIYIFFYFVLILSLKIWFNFLFILTLILIFMTVICFSLIIFLIEIFYLSNLVLILLIGTCFIWNNLWNCNYYYFNFITF